MNDQELIQAMADAIRDLLVVVAGISADKEEAIASARELVQAAKERTNG